jgi:hypothetical protein
MRVPLRAIIVVSACLAIALLAIWQVQNRRHSQGELDRADVSDEQANHAEQKKNGAQPRPCCPGHDNQQAALRPVDAHLPPAKPFVRPVPPPDVAGWYEYTENQRLDIATEFQHHNDLKPETVAFFKDAIRDKGLGLVTRNNIANVLILQQKNDPTLAPVFLAMVEDKSEDYLWREYAVQHLASSADWAADKEAVVAALWRQVETGDGSIPGTALLHLHYLDQRKVAPMPNTLPLRIGALLANDKADVATRMTCMGIVGQRRLGELAPALRTLADGAHPELRRVAIANLGFIGNSMDLDRLHRLTKDKDPSLSAAAKGAEKRLLASLAAPSTAKPRHP